MEFIPLEKIKNLVLEQNWTIRWTGLLPSGVFGVQLCDNMDSKHMYLSRPEEWKDSLRSSNILEFEDRDEDQPSSMGICPPDSTWLKGSRLAAVLGVNIGGDCTPGACKKYNKVTGCTISYDIETSMKDVRHGSFGLIDSEIMSIASRCSCGDEFYTSKLPDKKPSQSMVSEFLSYLLNHSPLWTIGWNCYTFDNECLRYHAHHRAKDLFIVSRIGGFGNATYGSILNIPGAYNVDLLIYMSKSMYGLKSHKLSNAADELGVSRKLEMPDMRGEVDYWKLRTYNMNDCIVVIEIWEKEKLVDLIPSLAICTASPIYDCARYVSGTLAAQVYSTFVLARSMSISWGICSKTQKYKGGYVMNPRRGAYNHIVVCDFKSMYPTIMASCNIDPHGFSSEHTDSSVVFDDVVMSGTKTSVNIGDAIVTFDNNRTSPMSELMWRLVSERDEVKLAHPLHANVLKIASNSVYGSLGYSNSALYSPSCAASVTAIGRFSIQKARSVFESAGLTVVYGDTDSCMVTGADTKEELMRKVQECLDDIHGFMRNSPLYRMKMALEEYYEKGLMIDKKRYCLLRDDGKIKAVGVSIARRDVYKICQIAAETTINAMFKDNIQDTYDEISSFVTSISHIAIQGKFRVKDISRYVKRNGRKGYEYPGASGELEFASEDNVNLEKHVECDVAKVLQSVSAEIERFTLPGKLGGVHDIMRKSNVFVL